MYVALFDLAAAAATAQRYFVFFSPFFCISSRIQRPALHPMKLFVRFSHRRFFLHLSLLIFFITIILTIAECLQASYKDSSVFYPSSSQLDSSTHTHTHLFALLTFVNENLRILNI